MLRWAEVVLQWAKGQQAEPACEDMMTTRWCSGATFSFVFGRTVNADDDPSFLYKIFFQTLVFP
jgi:hypothetical protein